MSQGKDAEMSVNRAGRSDYLTVIPETHGREGFTEDPLCNIMIPYYVSLSHSQQTGVSMLLGDMAMSCIQRVLHISQTNRAP